MTWPPPRQRKPTPAIDGEMEERLLSGELAAADIPTELAAVAAAVAAARAAAMPDEFNGQADLVAAMTAIARQRAEAPPSGRRSWPLRKKGAVVVIAAIASFGTAGVAAAARGSLPGSTQNFVSHAASHLDVTFPTVAPRQPNSEGGQHPTTPAATTASTGVRAAPTTTTAKPTAGPSTTGGSVTVGPRPTFHVAPIPSSRPTVTESPTTEPATTQVATTQPATTTTASNNSANAGQAAKSAAAGSAAVGDNGNGAKAKGAAAGKVKKPKDD